MEGPRTWLIDASIYIFRAWFSMPDRWHTAAGEPVQAVYGYTKFLLDFIARTGTAGYCAAAFDQSLGSNYRNALYPSYKSSRELPDAALAFQLQACREVTERLGVPCFGGARYEADDYIATIARHSFERGIPVTVVTRDKDLGQILRSAEDRWWDFAQDEVLDTPAFVQKFGVLPAQFPDYLALVGDPVDDIPGVPGVGAKTAAALLQAFGTLEGLARNLDRVATLKLRGAAGVQQRLQEHFSQVLMARQLTALDQSIAEVSQLPEFQLRRAALDDLLAYLAELNLSGAFTRRCLLLQRELPA